MMWLTGYLVLVPLTEVEKTRCQLEREHILGAAGTVDAQRPLPPGLFVPECDKHGHYAPTQCHGSTGYCWCVDRDGRELEGTRTRPGMRPPCKLEAVFEGCGFGGRGWEDRELSISVACSQSLFHHPLFPFLPLSTLYPASLHLSLSPLPFLFCTILCPVGPV